MKYNYINAWDTATTLNGRHFVHHLGICNQICVKLLQLISGVITHNSVEIEFCIIINGWVTANYSVSRPSFCPKSWNLLSDLCQTLTDYVRYYSAQFKQKDASISNRFSGINKRGIYTDTQHTHTHLDIEYLWNGEHIIIMDMNTVIPSNHANQEVIHRSFRYTRIHTSYVT